MRDAVADIAACALLALATMERRAGKNTEREALIAMVLSIHQYDSAVKHAAKWGGDKLSLLTSRTSKWD